MPGLGEFLIDANAYNPADETRRVRRRPGRADRRQAAPRSRRDGDRALKAVWHRGAVDADGKTGDGAGIRVDVPQDFFRDAVRRTGHTMRNGQASPSARSSCRAPIWRAGGARRSSRPKSCASASTSMAGASRRSTPRSSAKRPTRRGPRSSRSCSRSARRTRPASSSSARCYICRRRIEKARGGEHCRNFYVCSLSRGR
jgi:glutamate synthase (NADPH/NADH) large chain